jgi:CRP/FNR family transcriptional regulator
MYLNQIFTNPSLILEIEKVSKIKKLKINDVIINPGDKINFIPIVLSGSIRILKHDENGDEVFLYYLKAGDTCALSLTCCQTNQKSMIKGICEGNTTILQIPIEYYNDWLKYDEWKLYTNLNYHTRFNELLHVIDIIAFQNMDKQLLYYLNEKSKALNTRFLKLTHQEIALELNTHREAISRLLRILERQNILYLGRNSIELKSTLI